MRSFDGHHGKARRPGGFTLIELLVGILVVGILLSLLLVALRGAHSAGLAGAERRSVNAVKIAVVTFKDRFGFLPPLLKDQKTGSGRGPVITYPEPVSGQTERKFNIYDVTNDQDLRFLRGEGLQPADEDLRFSEASLPYYLAGACPVRVRGEDGAAPIDGVPGAGFLPPNADGTYKLTEAQKKPSTSAPRTLAGRVDPLVDTSKPALRLITDLNPDTVVGEPSAVKFANRKGDVYRYYRWLPDAKLKTASGTGSVSDAVYEDFYNIPIAVADWSAWKDNPQIRDARYAVVLPGADGLYGDEDLSVIAAKFGVPVPGGGDPAKALRSRARADNLVEFGS